FGRRGRVARREAAPQPVRVDEPPYGLPVLAGLLERLRRLRRDGAGRVARALLPAARRRLVLGSARGLSAAAVRQALPVNLPRGGSSAAAAGQRRRRHGEDGNRDGGSCQEPVQTPE